MNLIRWFKSLFVKSSNAGTAKATGKNSIAKGGNSGDGESGQIIITDAAAKVIFDSWNTEAKKRRA